MKLGKVEGRQSQAGSLEAAAHERSSLGVSVCWQPREETCGRRREADCCWESAQKARLKRRSTALGRASNGARRRVIGWASQEGATKSGETTLGLVASAAGGRQAQQTRDGNCDRTKDTVQVVEGDGGDGCRGGDD